MVSKDYTSIENSLGKVTVTLPSHSDCSEAWNAVESSRTIYQRNSIQLVRRMFSFSALYPMRWLRRIIILSGSSTWI